jgi:hypothetical protein
MKNTDNLMLLISFVCIVAILSPFALINLGF